MSRRRALGVGVALLLVIAACAEEADPCDAVVDDTVAALQVILDGIEDDLDVAGLGTFDATDTFGALDATKAIKQLMGDWAWAELRVVAYLESDAPADLGQRLAVEAAAWPGVIDVQLVDKAKAYEEALELFADNPSILATIEGKPEIIPASVRIETTSNSAQDVAARLETTPGVLEVRTPPEVPEPATALTSAYAMLSLNAFPLVEAVELAVDQDCASDLVAHVSERADALLPHIAAGESYIASLVAPAE